MKEYRKMGIIAALLIAVMVFTCACGSTDGDAQENTAGDTSAGTESEAVSEAADAEEEDMRNISWLSVTDGELTDSDGKAVQLRGVSTHGLSWYPGYVNQESFSYFHDTWNANLIRLSMYTAEYNGYCTGGNQEELKALVKSGVQYAVAEDMYVIIDWHILSDGNPNTYKEEAKAFFAEMSAEFADCPNVIYEICNEPNGGVTWAEVKSYAEEVIPVIRANSPDSVIIVGTPTWSQDVDAAAADPLTGCGNVMYALHFYAATHKDDIRAKLQTALDAGLPVFVSEFGICDASGNGAIDEAEAEKWLSMLDENGISYAAWNVSNADETSAIFKASCDKTSGWTEDDLSESGKWLLGWYTR